MVVHTRQAKPSTYEYSADEKKFFVELWKLSPYTPTEFARKKGITPNLFCSWKRQYVKMEETLIDTFHGKGGRPRLLDESALINLSNKVTELNKSEQSPSKKEFMVLCGTGVVETKSRRGQGVFHAEVSKKTASRILKQIQQNQKGNTSKNNKQLITHGQHTTTTS